MDSGITTEEAKGIDIEELALSKNQVIYHRGERRVRRVLIRLNNCLSFLMPLRSPCALR